MLTNVDLVLILVAGLTALIVLWDDLTMPKDHRHGPEKLKAFLDQGIDR